MATQKTNTKKRIRWDYNKLKQYGDEHNIIFNKDYSNDKLNRDTIIKAKCLGYNCDCDVQVSYRSFVKTGCFCIKCKNKIRYEKIKASNLEKYGHEHPMQCEDLKTKMKATNLERYGHEHPMQREDVKNKIKVTNLERYGHEHPFQSEDVKDKIKATNLERYGHEYATQSEEVKDKVKVTNIERHGHEYPMQREDVKDKIKATNLERYGHEHSSQCEDVKDKMKATNIERYGYEYSFQSEDVRHKIKATNLERYGHEHAIQCEDVKNKIKATNLERHGHESPMQNAKVFEKNKSSCYKKKEYVFPSGRTNLVQGYEPQALDILIKQHQEDDIVTDNIEIETLCGSIWYTFENKKHRYYPDIYIKSSNTIIEIKSTYTFEVKKEINLKKRQACIEAGVNFEFWVMNEKGEILSKF